MINSLAMVRWSNSGRLIAATVAVLLAVWAFHGGLQELVARWSRQEEYSHGFLIPVVSAWMLWSRRQSLIAAFGSTSWLGPVLLLISGALLIVGELSSFFLLIQIGFIIALMGIVLSVGGIPALRVAFIPLAFLAFAIPLPYFVDAELSWRLQLISSQLGVFFIRLFGVPVYLTGNIIDLGLYKLQVAEACSGLRYLYPLLSFGFLAAYMFQTPLWQRAVIFLSTIPITVVMNSFRIAMVGLLVDRWGIQQAEGWLHFFEGWIIFMACAGILALEILFFARFFLQQKFFDIFHLPTVSPSAVTWGPRLATALPLVAGLCLLGTAATAASYVTGRQEIIPDRLRFVSFPTELGAWRGRPSLLEPQVEHKLALDDYILSDYVDGSKRLVNFYAAYYPTQRKGASPHSPVVCIPGGGWQIVNFARTRYNNPDRAIGLPLNRVVIAQDKAKQLVYYWFVQRGRNVANEYWSKWFLFVDAIAQNRTDGALVRLVTPLYPNEPEDAADRRLQSFIDEMEPRLRAYLPQEKPESLQTASKL